jgi:hypothetical protein
MGEDSGINLDVDISEILCLEKPQKLLSTHNKARHHCYKKTKTSYNRAGRLIDQLEAAGIVGPLREVKHVVYIQT